MKQVDADGKPKGELKRIYVYKYDMMPPDADGMQQVTTIFRIVDNPIWFPAIMLSLAALAGGALTYSITDRIDTYAESSSGLVNSVALASGLIGLLWFVSR